MTTDRDKRLENVSDAVDDPTFKPESDEELFARLNKHAIGPTILDKIPVAIDPTMPPDTLELRSAKQTITATGIGPTTSTDPETGEEVTVCASCRAGRHFCSGGCDCCGGYA